MQNVDERTVRGFGQEWAAFDQTAEPGELDRVFGEYFALFPWDQLPAGAVGFDLGCGSGRWAARVAPRVGHLHCVDASAEALAVARQTVGDAANVTFHHASVGDPLPAAPFDFGYSLGVLHHVPDTARAIRACADLLKPGAPFLLYLYYALEDRPVWFRALWKASDLGRRGISRMPFRIRRRVTDAIAVSVYLPLARVARAAEGVGAQVEHWPLSAYRDRTLYAMRTDALDRFGTRLEQRFTRDQIARMLADAGFVDPVFADSPKWVVVSRKR
jgi:SAM-dependent methyltransferase